MKRPAISLWITTLLMVACGAPADVTHDPLVVQNYSTPIVLLISPDSAELENLHERLGADFYTVADDAMWYRAAAYDLLEREKIDHEERTRGEASFLVDGEVETFSWQNVDMDWFLVLYDGATRPTISADIDFPDLIARLR
jgi:hypothetical protein